MRRSIVLLAVASVVVAAGFRCPGPDPQAGSPPPGGQGGSGGDGGDGGDAGGGGCDGAICGDECVDLDSDVDHCGACDRPCDATGVVEARCIDGVCDSTCESGLVNISLPPSDVDDDGCETEGRRVFVTAGPVPALLMGAMGADDLCRAIADDAGLGGDWMAWISDMMTWPSTRFTQSTVPYVLVDGTPVANGFAGLIGGSLQHAIDMNELGTTVLDAEVWTGTSLMGDPSTYDCLSWMNTGATVSGTVGLSSGTESNWTMSSLANCDRMDVHLYCFEQ
jgi:hypothetical protein